MIKAEKQDLEAMRRAALKFRNVGLSRALTTWAVWGAQRALYKQNAFLLASHHAGVVSQVILPPTSTTSHLQPPPPTPHLTYVVSQLVLVVAWDRQVEPSAARQCVSRCASRDEATRAPPPPRHRGVEGAGAESAAADGVGQLRSIRAALVKWMEIISSRRGAREDVGAVGRMPTRSSRGFLGWLGAVEAIATAKALMALCVHLHQQGTAAAWSNLRVAATALHPLPISYSPGDCFGVALVDGIRQRLPPCAVVLSFMHRALAGRCARGLRWLTKGPEGGDERALGRLRNRDWARALIGGSRTPTGTLRVKGIDGVGAALARRAPSPVSPRAPLLTALATAPSLLTPVPGAAPAAGRRRPPPPPAPPARSPYPRRPRSQTRLLDLGAHGGELKVSTARIRKAFGFMRTEWCRWCSTAGPVS